LLIDRQIGRLGEAVVQVVIVLRRPHDVERFGRREIVHGRFDHANIGIFGRDRAHLGGLAFGEGGELGGLVSVDISLGSNRLREQAREVAAAWDQIHHAHARLDVGDREHLGGLALGIEPSCRRRVARNRSTAAVI
jgi:hypothetical protein